MSPPRLTMTKGCDALAAGGLAGGVAAVRSGTDLSPGSPAFVLLSLVCGWLVLRLLRRLIRDVPRRGLSPDAGSVTVSFLLCFPLFLMIAALIVQLALICNAQVVVNYAAFAAGRSAVTSLSDGHHYAEARIRRAAGIALAGVSPASPGVNGDSQRVHQALVRMNAQVDRRFAQRLAFATSTDGLSLDYQPRRRFVNAYPTDLTVSLQYRFVLKVPFAARLLSTPQAVAGVPGRFIRLHGQSTQRTPPGRELIQGLGGVL